MAPARLALVLPGLLAAARAGFSGLHAPAHAVAPPRAAVLALTYPEYVKEKALKESQERMNGHSEAPPSTFGTSSSLIDDADLITAAQEAAEKAGHAEKFTASQIVIAFNAWKLTRGVNYKSKEEAAAALRDFASDMRLITTHLEAAESALFSTGEASNPYESDELSDYLNSQWRDTWKQACLARKDAEAQRNKAQAGKAAAEDKLKQAMAAASKQEKSSVASAEADYAMAIREAEERAGQERARLAQLLSQVAADEKDAREAAFKKLAAFRNEAALKCANALATAQADREGAMHMFKQMESQALAAIQAADKEASEALQAAQEQEEAARLAAEKKAALVIAAQSEARALLELLKQSKEEAAANAARMEEEKREMEKQVDLANKRVRKAKLAAAAALEDL